MIDQTIANEQFAELGPLTVLYTAAFLKFYAPKLTVQIVGSGTVTSTSVVLPNSFTSPGTFSCATDTCPAALFVQGTKVTLTATTVATWGGDCASAGTSATATVALTVDMNCTATFAPSPFAGSWNLVDIAQDGESYPGTLVISQVAANGSFAFTIGGAGGLVGTGTSTGSNFTLDGTYRSLRAHWVGVLDPTGTSIGGTWTQSDGQHGSFTATR